MLRKILYGFIALIVAIHVVGISYVLIAEKTPAEITQERIEQAKKAEQEQEIKQASWIATSQTAVKNRLKDPRSAEFRNVFFKDYEGAPMVCGEVNSNNGFGGKAGFQRFIASGEELVYMEEEVSDFNKAWSKICKQ